MVVFIGEWLWLCSLVSDRWFCSHLSKSDMWLCSLDFGLLYVVTTLVCIAVVGTTTSMATVAVSLT